MEKIKNKKGKSDERHVVLWIQFMWITLFFRDFNGLTQRSALSQGKMASMVRKTTMPRGREDEVYVAAVPLRATKGPAQLLMSAAYSLNLWDLQHFMVLLKPHSPSPQFQVSDFSFLVVFYG